MALVLTGLCRSLLNNVITNMRALMYVNTHAHETLHDWLRHEVLNRVSLPHAWSPERVWKVSAKEKNLLTLLQFKTLDRPTGCLAHPILQMNGYPEFLSPGVKHPRHGIGHLSPSGVGSSVLLELLLCPMGRVVQSI